MLAQDITKLTKELLELLPLNGRFQALFNLRILSKTNLVQDTIILPLKPIRRLTVFQRVRNRVM
jgi:hypothetical protein